MSKESGKKKEQIDDIKELMKQQMEYEKNKLLEEVNKAVEKKKHNTEEEED